MGIIIAIGIIYWLLVIFSQLSSPPLHEENCSCNSCNKMRGKVNQYLIDRERVID